MIHPSPALLPPNPNHQRGGVFMDELILRIA
jgi:hypothetical protein